jgi:Ni,Fe-hydrogenase III component G
MNLLDELRQNLTGHLSDEKSEVDVQIAVKIAEEFAIQFHLWMRKNDTPENADIFFGYSDKDMMNVFKHQ